MGKDMTVADLPRLNWRRFKNKPAYIFEDRVITWGELHSSVNRLANALIERGVHKGDKIAILARNSIDWVVAYFGVLSTGAVLVPINVLFGPKEIAHTVDHCDAVGVLTGSEFAATVHSVRADMPRARFFISLDHPAEGFESLVDVLDKSVDGDPEISVSKADDALILYTGGTTGTPKGAVITHGAHFGMIFASALWCDVKERDMNLNLLPLYHNAGLHMTMKCSFMGATTILHQRPDSIRMMEDIQRYGITRTAIVTGVLQQLLQTPGLEKYDAATMRWVMAAGSILTNQMFEQVRTIFPKADFVQGWGLTDATSLLTVLQSWEALSKEGSCGKPYSNVELRIVDPNEHEQPAGKVGEIVVRGDTVMREYYKMPDLTAQTLRAGWLHTGDLGRMDEDGYLYFVDRLKDIIRSGDETIYAMDLENVIYQHPAVKECAVIAVPDSRWTETPKAVVVLKQGAQVTEAELLEFVRDRLASSFMRPTSIDFWDSLPRTHVGKVYKPAIREKYVPAKA
ncbi:MAG TPA: AMP-binding protein [Candidatus Micrarchaeaceae archaeon]|nr:AMP-binding protein [Candidatus Micrarchaeaceae archaeon]